MNWRAVQDGTVITADMRDSEVWTRCQMFGAEPLSEALEGFINELTDIIDFNDFEKFIELDKHLNS
jgi:hypothetical protein